MISFSEYLWIALLLIPVVWAMSDILRRPDAVWERSRHSQILWVIFVLLAPLIGPVLYYLIARPDLQQF